MHMADALLSPGVGGTMWGAAALAVAVSARKINETLDEKNVPMMGVMGAFVFAAQMINFTIPGTGSSGHLAGGILLCLLLGPYAAVLAMASVLTVQALFFADGGLLALGCNIFNLAVMPCFIVYPLVCRPLLRLKNGGTVAIAAAALIGSVLAMQAGAAGVVIQTVISGVSELPFKSFLAVMLPIHLAIGAVEGAVTVAVVKYVQRTEPGILEMHRAARMPGRFVSARLLAAIAVASVLMAGILSWFASEYPDGLEWSIARITGHEELENRAAGGAWHSTLAAVQERTAVLPDYAFKEQAAAAPPAQPTPVADATDSVPLGTSLSGLLGAAITLLLIGLVGWFLRRRTPALTNLEAKANAAN